MKNPTSVRVRHGAWSAGFTLIELLTVIAIIAVLAGMTAVAVPRYLEKAQTTKAEANMANVVQGLSSYAAETGNTTGYPAAYGFIKQESRDIPVANLLANPELHYVLKPYTIEIGIHQVENVYELPRWTQSSYDSNNNKTLDLLEYSPLGLKDPASNNYSFSDVLYTGVNDPEVAASGFLEATEQMRPGKFRPFVYVPFNSRQLATVQRYWIGQNDVYGESLDSSHADLQGRLFFPPAQYDGFVLIGNGPGGDNGNVVAGPPAKTGAGYEDAHIYHINALRVAFLATRDIDDDKLLDFEFRDRKNASSVHLLPPGAANRNSYGAFIKVVK